MRIIALRHEITDYNEKNLLQGLSDIPLNEEGKKRCGKLKEELKKYNIDYIISSPLQRAVMTSSLVSDAPLFIDERLKERVVGLYEGKHYSLYDSDKYADYDLNLTEDGVESIRDVLERTFDLLDEVASLEDKTILLVSHGGIIKCMPYYFIGLPKNKMLNEYKVENGEYLIFENRKEENI